MPLNKLENFIKNYEGRILYVNSNDLDATDSITNQGNSLTKPFKTIQRAVLEAARFSFVPGENNDKNDRTTILVYPGEHLIDNRPGFGIRKAGTALAEAVSPSGQVTSPASDVFTLNLQSNFDLTQEDNILYKFNSVNGGVILPRGTSLIGLDLRKTKIRPKYVPNPTDEDVPSSAFFRVTGNCFFWNFSIFDANQTELVYTDNRIFGRDTGNQAIPTFSHHKLTVFEYVDGVNLAPGYNLTDLDMYYAKLSNAYNEGSGREVPAAQKFPLLSAGFAKERSEWEIVGAFGTDPIQITDIYSGDRATPGQVVQVTTLVPHNLTVDTPIKIRGCNTNDYNISTVVQSVPTPTTFTYLLSAVRNNLPADPGGSVTVTIDTDSVRGASPYIFNCSLRSVWGLNGMHADGGKASGFRSMVVAQYTAVSLQKDDRAFVKYDPITRTYNGIAISRQTGSQLSAESASTNSDTVYHLDSGAVYRRGWETSHIKMTNDAIIQIVSVFAIGFNKHFDAQSGGDASITNSNSNFGQFSLVAEGFKKEAFEKDDYAYLTSIITPRHIPKVESNIDWISIDVGLTTSVGITSHLYLFGFRTLDNVPPSLIQGYRVGARENDILYLRLPDQSVVNAKILMSDNVVSAGSTYILGSSSASKSYDVSVLTSSPSYDTLTLSTSHQIQTGEKIIILSDDGDLPENVIPNKVYYAIKVGASPSNQIRIASSFTNAVNGVSIKIYGGSRLKIISRVSDKESGELGSPVQYDSNHSNWFVHVETGLTGNPIYNALNNLGVVGFGEPRTDVSFVKRIPDNRSLDEKIYKFRISIPKESPNSRDLSEGFVIQETSKTGAVNSSEFNLVSINNNNYDYKRNHRFISTCTESSGTVTVISEKPHDLNRGDRILISNIKSSTNLTGVGATGYNGDFAVASVVDHKTFTYSTTDNNGITHNVGIFSGSSTRDLNLPRFERNDIKSNFYIYRVETISPYVFNVQDGVYHAYVLKSDVSVPGHFSDYKYNQNVVDLYPQLDRDNINPNPNSTKSFAKASPLGEVITNDLKKSLTREALDTFVQRIGLGITITSITSISAGISTITLSKEHGLNGIVGYANTNFTSGHTNGTYHNVRLLNQDATWNGATARVIVSGGSITSLVITDGGSGYQSGQTLSIEGFGNSTIGITTSVISSAVNNVIQITGGDGTSSDGLYRVFNIPTRNTIGIARTSGDPTIVANQYVFNVGLSTRTSEIQHSTTTGISTFIFNSNHGLVAGNTFRVLDDNFASSNNRGDYVVLDVVGVTSFTSLTNTTFPSGNVRILKHGFNTNDLTSDSGAENLGARGVNFYANETGILGENIITGTTGISTFRVSASHSGLSTTTRFSLGDYIQIDNEIMRIASSTLTGSGNDEVTVLRGYFGTAKENHTEGSLISKIRPIPIELRRPSILRASGHTFEYLGYGPGNYSTGLPQIQVKTLSEREDFLVQSQERSGGSALYTGMNSDGDFFIGNTKYSSSSGQQTTFDIPIPTITGQNPSRLSVVFDEVIVKERILVEGGKSKQILSQFDGPVTFNQNIIVNNETTKINGQLISSGTIRLNETTDSTSVTTGSLVARGGFGIAKNLNVGGNVSVAGTTTFNGEVQFNSGLVPDSIEDAYLGSSTKPWANAWVGGIGIATEGVPGGTEIEDRTINAWTGELILNGVGAGVSITSALYTNRDAIIAGILTVGTRTVVINGAENTVAIGRTGQISLDPTTGALRFTSNNPNAINRFDRLRIDDTLRVDGQTTLNNALTITAGNVTVSAGNVNITGELTSTVGLFPATDSGAPLGSLARSFSEVFVDNLRLNDNTLSSTDTNGNIVLSPNGTGIVRTNADVNFGADGDLSTLTVTGQLNADNLRLDANSITSTNTNGNIVLDANGTGIIEINSPINVEGTSILRGVVTVHSNIIPETDITSVLGSTTRKFAEAHIGNLQLAVGNVGNADNTITVSTGNLFLGPPIGTQNNTTINGDLNILGTTALGRLAATTIVPTTPDAGSIGEANTRWGEAYIGNLILAQGENNSTITTRTGNGLVLTSANNTVTVTGSLNTTGDIIVGTDIYPDADGANLGTPDRPWNQSCIGNLRLAMDADNNIITTSTGNLELSSQGSNIVRSLKNFQVVNNSSMGVDGSITAGTVLVINGDEDVSDNANLGSLRTAGGARIAKDLRVGGRIRGQLNFSIIGSGDLSGTFNNTNDVTFSISSSTNDRSGDTIVKRTGGDIIGDVGDFNSVVARGTGNNNGNIEGGNINANSRVFSKGAVDADGDVTTKLKFKGKLEAPLRFLVAGGAEVVYDNSVSHTISIPYSTRIDYIGRVVGTDYANATPQSVVEATTAGNNAGGNMNGKLVVRGNLGGIVAGSGGVVSYGDVIAYSTSDKRLKTNILQIENALDKVCSLSGITFNWNDTAVKLNDGDNAKNPDIRETGIIAQEVQKVLPEVVNERDNGYLAVNYEKLVPLLIEAIKELKSEIEELKAK